MMEGPIGSAERNILNIADALSNAEMWSDEYWIAACRERIAINPKHAVIYEEVIKMVEKTLERRKTCQA